MGDSDVVILKRDVEASVVPVGTRVTIHAGEEARVTQALGGSFTVIVNGNMFRVDGKDADALGREVVKASLGASGVVLTKEAVEKLVWDALKTCFDPEIPVNIVDLGLVYHCEVADLPGAANCYKVDVKMTLTAPGCGMGPVLQQDVHNKLISIEAIDEVNVELVWDPPWNQGLLSEAAKLQLGLL